MKTCRFTFATLAATLVLGLAACTNTNNEPDDWKVEDDPITTTLQATIAGANTRVSMDENADTKNVECKWETGDQFRLIHSFTIGGNNSGKEQVYTLTKGVGESIGTFTTTDESPTGNGLYYAFYPETTTYKNGSEKFYFSPQMWSSNASIKPTQSKDAPLAHLKPFHYLGATGTYTNGYLETMTFQPMTSIVSFDITISGDQSISPESVAFKSATGKRFRTSNLITLGTDGKMSDSAGWTSTEMPLKLSGYDNVTTFTANFMLPYQDMSTLTFIIKITAGTDTYVSEAFAGIKLLGGKRYTKAVTVTKQ